MKLTRLYFIFTGIIILFLYGCAANYTILLVDEENQVPVVGIPIEILDEDGTEKKFREHSNEDGQFEFDLKKIEGDSFKVLISGDDYFKIDEWIDTPRKSTKRDFVLEKLITIIIGYVIDEDDENYSGIPNCEITTIPEIYQKVFTDKDGKFVIKSDEFASGVSYTIFASKPPDYIESTTDFIPHIDKKTILGNVIFLTRAKVEEVEIKGREGIERPEGIDLPINDVQDISDED